MVGNLSNFTKIDILRCLLKIDEPLSRLELSKKLDLGEGTIRSILDILQKNELLASNNKGHYLSSIGNKIVKSIKQDLIMKNVELHNIFPDKKKIAVQLKNFKKIDKSYILRDEALKNGSDGALILKFDKKLRLYDSDYEQDFSNIENIFDLDNKDIVILTYAESFKLAEHGALAVGLFLNIKLNDILQKLK